MTGWPDLVLFFHCSGPWVYPDTGGVWIYTARSPAPVLSPSLKAQAGYYSYFVFCFFSNGMIKICIHPMSPILSKFFHGSFSYIERCLLGLECCKALLAQQPSCFSLPSLSPSFPPPSSKATSLSLTGTDKIVHSSAVKSKVHSFQSISKALLNPCRD